MFLRCIITKLVSTGVNRLEQTTLTLDDKIRLLEKLITKSKDITVEDSEDATFKSWRHLVERTLIKIYGRKSTVMTHFYQLTFFYQGMSIMGSQDYSAEHLEVFKKDFSILIKSINDYIEEFQDEVSHNQVTLQTSNGDQVSKVFISHASDDSSIVEEMIEILETIGLDHTQIFCTSFDGYGIDLGENFLDAIKQELSSNSLVIFMLSDRFYKSPVCLCEMGASWVLAKQHFPVLIPPFDYSNIEGVIPLTQGIKINEPLKINLLKEKIEELFSIETPLVISSWERKRDRILTRINNKLESYTT